MNNFTNKVQSSFYQLARPRYTKGMFDLILSNCKGLNTYLDLACGTGQLLFQLSPKFKQSYGIDSSQEQLDTAHKSIINNNNNVKLLKMDGHQLSNHFKLNPPMIGKTSFDLITIGQAFHWFEADKILPILKEILDANGLLALTGYKKQHFKPSDPLYNIYKQTIEQFIPYFDGDVAYNDSGYVTFDFGKYFSNVNHFRFEEETAVSLLDIVNEAKSWSAYINYKKKHQNQLGSTDPIEVFYRSCYDILSKTESSLSFIEEKKIKYYTFYYLKHLKN